jgi:hypothetical protein
MTGKGLLMPWSASVVQQSCDGQAPDKTKVPFLHNPKDVLHEFCEQP